MEIEKCQAAAPAGNAVRHRFSLFSLPDSCTVTKHKGEVAHAARMERSTAVPDRQRKLHLLIFPPQLVFAKWKLFD